MARWILCALTTFEISHFQHVDCACKNPISPKVFNRFSKSLPQLEDFEGGHLGGKFEARRYFAFAMAKWKLCPSTTFEILPLSTCTRLQQKSYTYKGIQPIFEIFGSARRCWGRAFVWKDSSAQVFYFCNGRWKPCACTTFEISHFQSVHCYSKNPISPKVFNRFSKSSLQLEDVDGGHMCEKFEVRRYGTFPMARWKLCASTTFEISHFQTVHCPSKNPISPMVFNRFSKSLPQHEDFVGGQLDGQFQARRYGTFAMARRKFCACTTIVISHFQPVYCASKNPTHVSPKVFNRFSTS